jgi:hypothetical protein
MTRRSKALSETFFINRQGIIHVFWLIIFECNMFYCVCNKIIYIICWVVIPTDATLNNTLFVYNYKRAVLSIQFQLRWVHPPYLELSVKSSMMSFKLGMNSVYLTYHADKNILTNLWNATKRRNIGTITPKRYQTTTIDLVHYISLYHRPLQMMCLQLSDKAAAFRAMAVDWLVCMDGRLSVGLVEEVLMIVPRVGCSAV